MKLRHRIYFLACAIVAVGWVVFAFAGHRFADAIGVRFGGTLHKMAQGKFTNAGVFVYHRLGEALWLASIALMLLAVQGVFNRLVNHRIKRAPWAAKGIAAFFLLNLWVGVAMDTALFWSFLGAGAGTQNLIQFHFKRILARENPIATRVVLVGSSQTRSQIDENILNDRFGGRFWTTELHFPGSHGYDLLLIERQLRRIQPQVVVCYLSEGYFYAGEHGQTPVNFLSFWDVRDGLRRGAQRYLSNEEILSGLLGDAVPLFRCRDAIAQRVFGPSAVQIQQQEHNESLAINLESRARDMAKLFNIDAQSEFQKRAFEDFIARCERAGRQVVLIVGGYNPILQAQIDPGVRKDMLSFLDRLKKEHASVTLVPQTHIIEQTAADYDDLNHVGVETQRRFTIAFAELLDRLVSKRADE